VARGATDDKGQLFAHVKAVEALLNTTGSLPGEIVFLIEGEEESGGNSLFNYVSDEGQDLKPEAVLISDGTMYDPVTPAITYGLRGIITFEMTVQGPAQDLHSGAYGGTVANPALVLTQLLSRCIAPNGTILVPHFYDDIAPLADWETKNLKELALNEQDLQKECGVPALHGEPGYDLLQRLWMRPTFEINGLTGGYCGDGFKTIIPSRASAKVSIRLVPDQEPSHIRQLVFDFLMQNCPNSVHLEFPWYAESAPIVFDIDSPLFGQAHSALQQGFGVEPVYVRTGGSIPVVNAFAQAWQCPVIGMGLGQDSDGPHSPNERFSLDAFVKGIKASAYFLQTL
jgi:succinyl-diaminopimelate desuccinylase